jgi:uncharacterized DUF497 family protein
MMILSDIKEFEWDSANIDKNQTKHNIGWFECEQIFFNKPLLLLEDQKHSVTEARYYAYGKTDDGKLLTVVFTIRGDKIRVISARPMSRKERSYYEIQKI